MRALSALEMVRIWEIGLEQHPIERALTILMVAIPETSWNELLSLSIGQRNARLLAVREQTFGTQFSGFATCVTCQEHLEFAFDAKDAESSSEVDMTQQMNAGGYHLQFRLPNSADLAAIAGQQDVNVARSQLVQQCVLQARQDGTEVAVETLPETAISALAARMAESDLQAELQLDLTCPACAHHWQLIFDIVSFFWMEISAQAKLLLREVHTLACAYGWREADILSLSTARRQFYLEMVT
jgi:hypothetical protein